MIHTLSKTDYILYRECAKNAWYKIHRPDIYFASELSDFEKSIIETGNEVEAVARKLFPDGVMVEGREEASQELTKGLIEEGAKVIFQPVFKQEGFLAAVDILERNDDGTYSIYEVKATNEIDVKVHIYDLAFQANLLEACGIKLKFINLMHLNSKYVRHGELEIRELFEIENLTDTIRDLQVEVWEEMKLAQDYLSKEDEPKGPCQCIYKGRSRHCTTFKYSNPNVPGYGIHDLARIGTSKAKLAELVDSNIFHIHEIPEHIEFSDTQKNQIWTYITDRTITLKEAIADELDKLVFPLYFLDYETFPAAIPRFTGFSPYQQIPFQYSLHVLHTPDGELEWKDFLYTKEGDPSEAFKDSLIEHIGPKGSVIVWHKSFECGRNKELAKRMPECALFMQDLESRIFDLEDIFKKQYHVHKDYKGSSSIKKILPVLVPDLSYKDLLVNNGGAAADTWNRIVTDQLSPEDKTAAVNNLRVYCKLDTYAMYAIWKELYKLVN
jgi:hypothetical protein